MTIDTQNLRDLIRAVNRSPLPWMLATSNSWRRIVDAQHTPVCQPIKQPDGHPDLLFHGGVEGPNAMLLIGAVNALPDLLATIEAQAAEIERLRCVESELRTLPINMSLKVALGKCVDRVEEQKAEIKRLRDMLRAVVEQLSGRQIRSIGDAPGHSHDRPGIWDDDNSELSGQPCAWCALWKEAVALQREPK